MMMKWFKKISNRKDRGLVGPMSRRVSDDYVQLPKNLNDLSQDYKELVRELAKR